MRLIGVRYRYPGEGSFLLGPLDVEGPDDRPWLILGPSGSGKSTLLRILGGGLPRHQGEIRGPRPGSSAYLPQLPERALAGRNLAEDLTGRIRPPVEERRRLRAALEASGLGGIPLSRRSRSLSAGERRRLALTLIRLSGHENWALDEPEAALDASGHLRLIGLLQARMQAENPPPRLWIGTHRFDLYGPLKPWVVVLSDGKIACYGDLNRVLEAPETPSALSLDLRPPFALWKALDRGGSSPGFRLETLAPKPDRETLVRLQLLKRMGIS